ncbi:MAG: ABC transporter permease [Pirellulales bacterium]
MSVLDRKLRREVRSSRGVVLLAIASIMTVGVMSFVYSRSLYNNLRTSLDEYYAESRMADFWVDMKKAPLIELAPLEEIRGVVEIRPRIRFIATVALEGVEKPLNGEVLSLPDDPRPIINDIVMRSGGYFTDRRADEVIVNDAFARAHDLRPGDSLHLILNNRRQELVIVGTAISSEFVYLLGPGAIVPDPQQFGVFYLKRSFAEDIFDMDGAANQVVGLLSGNPDVVLPQIERRLETYGAQSAIPREDQASHLFVSSEIQGLGVFSTIGPAIFLTVAALVLNILMSRLVEQQRTVIGTLKAIGYTDRQLFGHFIKLGLGVGLISGVLGAVAGYAMAEAITGIYRQFFEFPSLKNRPYPKIYLAGIAISLVFSLSGSLHGARNALRLRPAEAMRPKPPAEGGRIWLERLTWLWHALSFGWRMALRNALRNRVRTAVGIFTTAIGASLLVIGFMAQEAMIYLIDFQFHQISRFDIELGFESGRGWEALLEVRRLPGVDYAEPIYSVPCTFRSGPYERKGVVTGLSDQARLTTPRDIEGRPLRIPTSGLLMTRKVADLLRVEVGDRLVMQPTVGHRRPVTVPVAEIADSYLGTAVYAQIDYLSRLTGEAYALNGAQLAINPARQVQQTLYAELKELPLLQSTFVREDVVRNLQQTLIETQAFSIGILIVFAGVIFFGSVLNASLVNLAERQREVATLRVLGYSEWQIGALLLREAGVVYLFGLAAGLPLGYWLYVLMAHAYDMEFIRLPIVSRAWIWIWTIGLGLFFSASAHAVVQWRISRMNWLEALQTKE